MTTKLSSNERNFILEALKSEQRIDGRRPFDVRRVYIKFANEDGAAEVRLGQTRVMGVVTAQIVQPFRERPNEGTFSIHAEFSPMADPTFEFSRTSELSVELIRVIERCLKESRALDTESLCILSGKAVWALRIDLIILDNGGNLIDAANIAALAALMSFRRPECSVGGQEGREIVVHPKEMKEPLPLIIHHLPIALTFAFFGEGDDVVLDPSYKEEAVMGGRMTITMNAHGDVCGILKGGGVGISHNEMMRCLRIAAEEAIKMTSVIKDSVEAYNRERTQRKIKRHKPQVANPEINMVLNTTENMDSKSQEMDGGVTDMDVSSDEEENDDIPRDVKTEPFSGGPSKWDPFSEGLSKSELAYQSTIETSELELEEMSIDQTEVDEKSQSSVPVMVGEKFEHPNKLMTKEPQSLEDAIKEHAKVKRKKKTSNKQKT